MLQATQHEFDAKTLCITLLLLENFDTQLQLIHDRKVTFVQRCHDLTSMIHNTSKI